MKKWIAAAGICLVTGAKGQNEFAATAFYNEFKKISKDAQQGFILNKGIRKKAQFEELAEEYKAKLNLMLADSGEIVIPKNSNLPYAIYYFEPAKSRLKTDQRGADLREAVAIAYAKPLFAKTETRVVNEKAYSDTYIFANEKEDDKKSALFRISIFPIGNKYYLTLEIRGTRPPGPSTDPVP